MGTVHPALRGKVASVTGYQHRPPVDSVHFGLPSPTATLILAFDDQLDVGTPGSAVSERFWVMLAGLHDTPALVRTHGIQVGVQAALTPAGVRALFGMPIGELPAGGVELTHLPPLRALWEQLAGEAAGDRPRLLERWLMGNLERSDGVRPEATHAWWLLQRSGGRAPVREVAGEVGLSRRHLQTLFQAEYGQTPKTVARVARFTRALSAARTGRPLAEVATMAGFSDQAHLTREWRAMAGQSPTATLREPFPRLPDLAGNL